MLIKNALKFPDLAMLVIHGEIHNSQSYVWFNLPRLDAYSNSTGTGPVPKTVGSQSDDTMP